MSESTQDLIALEYHSPWWLPDLTCVVVKSKLRRRWCVILRLSTREAFDGLAYYDYQYWLQLRSWWPPIFATAGWLRRGEL